MDFARRPEFRILFVTKTSRVNAPYLDPSVRYRCFNPAEALSEQGIVSDVISLDQVGAEHVANYDAFVFHRPDGRQVSAEMLIKLVKSMGKTVIADYDDLTFNPEYALNSSIFLNGNTTKEKVRDIFWCNYKGFRLFDAFSVSTTALAEQVKRLNPAAKVEVVPNGLSRRLLDSYKVPSSGSAWRGGCKKVFSYLSGTASHVPDIAYVGDVLAGFLARHKEARLAVAGPIVLPEVLANRPGVVRLPYREFFDFFPSAADFYANIAPLAPGNMFNNCKSALKFFESGVWGVPTIASPIEDFKRFSDSSGLILADTPEEWDQALEKMFDEDFRQSAVAGLRDYCLERCMADGPAKTLLSFLQGGCRQ